MTWIGRKKVTLVKHFEVRCGCVNLQLMTLRCAELCRSFINVYPWTGHNFETITRTG